MDYNLIITSVIAVAAIISPIIVSVIDNRYSLIQFEKKVIQEREYKRQERINRMIDDYLVSTAELTVGDSINMSTLINYKKKYFALVPYMNTSVEWEMKEIDNLIDSKEWAGINEKLYFVADLLNYEIINK